MQSTRVMRAAGAAGVLATILILGGLYLANTGLPGNVADAAAWAAWAQREEFAIESGVYYLLVPGLFFFVAAGVLSSTTASAFGFYQAFEDPTAVTAFTGAAAGYHLQAIGVWSLAMTMVATAVGLRYSAAISMPLYVASIVLAVFAVAATVVGFGVILCLVWILASSIWLLRWTPSR
jgi:hypothetical protein